MNLKSKNLILIIGNGFDLAHRFKTSYNDFAKFIIEKKIAKTIIESEYQTYSESLVKKDFIAEVKNNSIYNDRGNFIQQVTSHKNNKNYEGMFNTIQSFSSTIKQIINNDFLGKLFDDRYDNWFDIENAYFQEIIQIENKITRSLPKKDKIKKLNKDLIEIKEYLFEYLKSIPTEKNHKVNRFFQSDLFKNIENLYIINFNYTLTIENYFENDFQNTKINYIHGDIDSKDIIFGYGNDKDPNYKKIKESGENEYLRFFKTFEYLRNKKYVDIYDNALEYFEDYDVSILGHSLSQTDKTLLKEVLDNPKCNRIHLHKRKDLEYQEKEIMEEFNTLIYSISRIIDNEKDLRTKVLNYEDSVLFPK